MNLLMITRKVDKGDGLSGFTYNWIKKLGQKLDNLYVICLNAGDTSGLGGNIKILSIRDNKTKNIIIRKIKDLYNFQKLLIKTIKKVDGVFCHMNPEYTIASYPVSKIFNKKIISWYAHSKVSLRLKILEKMTDKILTPSNKSFRLKSKKVLITGHGIDTEKFKPRPEEKKEKFTIVSIGRISPTKDIETLIKSIDFIINYKKEKDIDIRIIGSPGLSAHKKYRQSLQEMTEKMNLKNYIKFIDEIPNSETPNELTKADLFINLSGTGSVDKAVLEAMSCGVIVLTSNESFKEILKEDFLIKQNDFKELSRKILKIKNGDKNTASTKQELRGVVVKNHNLDNLTKIIVDQF